MDCVGDCRSGTTVDSCNLVVHRIRIDRFYARRKNMSMKKNIWMTVLTIITVCCVVGGTFHYYGIFSLREVFALETIESRGQAQIWTLLMRFMSMRI